MSDKQEAREQSAAAAKAEAEYATTGVVPEGYVYDPDAIRRNEPAMRRATADDREAHYDIRNPPHKARKD